MNDIYKKGPWKERTGKEILRRKAERQDDAHKVSSSLVQEITECVEYPPRTIWESCLKTCWISRNQ